MLAKGALDLVSSGCCQKPVTAVLLGSLKVFEQRLRLLFAVSNGVLSLLLPHECSGNYCCFAARYLQTSYRTVSHGS
jgi:hypothetical protein